MIYAALVVLLALVGCKVDAPEPAAPAVVSAPQAHTTTYLTVDPREACQPGMRPAFIVVRPGSPDEWVHLQRCPR